MTAAPSQNSIAAAIPFQRSMSEIDSESELSTTTLSESAGEYGNEFSSCSSEDCGIGILWDDDPTDLLQESTLEKLYQEFEEDLHKEFQLEVIDSGVLFPLVT